VLVAGEVPGTWRRQLAQVRVWVVGFAQQDGKRKGWSYRWVLVAGEVPGEGPGTCRRSAAGGRRSRSRRLVAPPERDREGREKVG
jgi:hypothetical protein